MTAKLARYFLLCGILALGLVLNGCPNALVSNGDNTHDVDNSVPQPPNQDRQWPPPPLPRVGERLPVPDGTFFGAGIAHGFASHPGSREWITGSRGPDPGQRIFVSIFVEDGWIDNVTILGPDESTGFIWHVFEFGPELIVSMNEFALSNQNIRAYTDVNTTATFTINGINEAGNSALQRIRNTHGSDTNININPKILSLEVGKYETLKAAIVPVDLPITWASSNEAVAIVDQTGKVTAVSEGTAIITATISCGEFTFTDRCLVKVQDSASL